MQIGVSSLPDRVPDPTSADPGAQTSGPGFDRLVQAAQAEADRRRAVAAQSGASADQFSEQSWLGIVKAHGGEIGLGAAASAITKDQNGQLTVADAALRAKVLNYRNDPMIRGVMAVKRTIDSRAVLNLELGRQPSDAEMRAAEAIGGKAAAKLILVRQSTPNASAVIATPEAAAVNRGLYYRPDGSPQTVNDVLVRLMKPSEAAAPAAMPGSALPGQGLTPAMALNLQAHTTFAAASQQPSAPQPSAPKPRAAPPVDLPLVGGTIASLSMPGSASGVAAPTGGKISGWRAGMAGEVTHQIEHPSSAVTNVPSNVTVPAPALPRPQAVMTVPAPTVPQQIFADRPATPPTGAAQSGSSLLGPQLAPAAVANTAPLPTLVAANAAAQTSALPLLPIEIQAPTMPSAPTSPVVLQPGVPAEAAPQSEPPVQPLAQVPVRPSRYGPAAATPPSRSLGFAPMSVPQETAVPDSSLAGIRPSRFYANSALAAQQFAALNRSQAPVLQSQPASTAYSQPLYPPAALGPDGLPILPPVPRPAGLPPLTATEALQPGGYQLAAQVSSAGQPATGGLPPILAGTKPLDLSPDAPAQQPPRPTQRLRPRTIPGRF